MLNILSLFGAVEKNWLIRCHVSLLILWMLWILISNPVSIGNHLRKLYRLIKKGLKNPRLNLFLPLLILIGLAAWIYPPNNYDSLTYHMARIVHWMQNKSIEYYPTPIDRQNVMGPGAEYLILFFQIMTQSDSCANFIQFSAYIALIVSTAYIGRILRLPRPWIPFIAVIASTAPIAVMEASNTKNDLVAALMTSAILIAGARLYSGSFRRMKLSEFVLIGICVASGFLVKPTSLIVSAPILFSGALFQLKSILKTRVPKKLAAGSLCVFTAFGITAGPDVYRKHAHHFNTQVTYPLFSRYETDRMWNPVRILAHNIPFPDQLREVLKIIGYKGSLITKDIFHLQEDMIGNPYQVLAFLALAFLSLLSSIFLFLFPAAWPHFLLSLTPVAAWALFGIVVKDQGWITRLNIPLFYILPFSFSFAAVLSRYRRAFKRTLTIGLACTAFPSLAYAALIACKVPARTLIPHYFWGEIPSRIPEYYNNAGLKDIHDSFIDKAKELNCNRIGLIMGGDSPEYPLTWRLMMSGKRFRHLRYTKQNLGKPIYNTNFQNLNWPCMIYACEGVYEHVPEPDKQWLSGGNRHIFHRNLKWHFDSSDKILMSLSASKEVTPSNHIVMSFNNNLLTLAVFGEDPQLLFPKLEVGNFSSSILKVVLSSPVETTAQLFYKTKDASYFNEKTSIKKRIKKGINELYFFLPTDEVIGQIRFDPGNVPGIYKISDCQIRGIKAKE